MARILAVTSRLPFPPREGHQLRAWHVLRALASRHEVTLLSFQRNDDLPTDAAPLHAAMARVETFRIPSERSRTALARGALRGMLTPTPFLVAKYDAPALRARLTALARDADLVHFDMLPLIAHADCVPEGVPVTLNAHNVEHRLLATRARIEPRAWARRFLAGQVGKLEAFERRACERADAVLACSEVDAQGLRELAPGCNVHVVVNGVDLHTNQPAAHAPDPDRLVFVGQMGWFPNRDGVEWFLREVFPRILARRPATRFELVGKAEGFEVPDAVRAHVDLAGFVDDLRPHVHDASVYVVPLRAGSGTRLKVLEAMALGKAIVTTSVGSEGIALRHDHSALYADDADGFANAVLSLLESPSRVAELGIEARRLAEDEYGWEAIGTRLLRAYEPLVAGGARPVRAGVGNFDAIEA
ncbi:glycosyltransferase family 4 protein [Lysobacter auxotrophicus]|uniref:Glycosyltransferase family 4 protein n=1 Tax=Lysobacter auxotrophicus TaxID=2992573 RepID=A0ABN6UIZ5_9GAMM|nr:glycosyltransferase family 4 protein [Lysobacter auxotrophicus]BDU16080.1 glycosyltransferase family 4 protein [Lysobacter auxotrophicus]